MAVLVDDEYELDTNGHIPTKVLAWLNSCSRDLTDVARYPGRAIYNYVEGTDEIALPDDFHRMVMRGGIWFEGDEIPEQGLDVGNRYGFRRWGNTLILHGLDDDGELELFYYRKIPKFTGDPDEEPVIPESFHDLYVLYASAKHAQSLWDEIETKTDFYREYRDRKRELEIYMMSNDTAPYPITTGRINYRKYAEEDFDTTYEE